MKNQKIQIPDMVIKYLYDWLHHAGWLELKVSDDSLCEYKIYQHVNDNGSFYRLLTISKKNKNIFTVINSLFNLYKFLIQRHADELVELRGYVGALDSIESFMSFLDESIGCMLIDQDKD